MLFPAIRLLIFTKAPELGRVKTRMQPALHPEFSLQLHQQLIDCCLQQWHQPLICPPELWVAGHIAAFESSLPQWQSLPRLCQRGRDLGERMANAVQYRLNHCDAVILVGTDCPFIDGNYLQAACTALASHQAVIGPASDGGYVLLGLKLYHRALFTDIDWGSPQVLTQTQQALDTIGWSYQVLPTLADIDRPEDLALLQSVNYPFSRA